MCCVFLNETFFVIQSIDSVSAKRSSWKRRLSDAPLRSLDLCKHPLEEPKTSINKPNANEYVNYDNRVDKADQSATNDNENSKPVNHKYQKVKSSIQSIELNNIFAKLAHKDSLYDAGNSTSESTSRDNTEIIKDKSPITLTNEENQTKVQSGKTGLHNCRASGVDETTISGVKDFNGSQSKHIECINTR